MKVHKVLRLPRNLQIKRRCPADARAYIRPLGRQQSAVPATKSAYEGSQSAAPATKSAHQAPVPSRRQGVHPTPWQAASAAHSAHGHTEVHKVLCLPRDLHMKVHKGAVHKVLRLPRNLHMKVHNVLRLPRNLHIKRRCPADARAYIRPLGKQQAPHTVHMEVHKVLCLPRDLHMKVHKVLRLPRNLHIKRRCPADARAYIRPLGKQQSAVPATRSAHGGSQSTCCACHEICT